MAGWCCRFQIAGAVIQVESDSDACKEDMWKFLQLYQPVSSAKPVLVFAVQKQADDYIFSSRFEGEHPRVLWHSQDAREISAALEIHLYSQTIQLLDPEYISLHASLLGIDGRAIMFAGESGSGKSSICTAGLLAGASYLSDEFGLLDREGMVHSFPRPMQWEHESHPAFDRGEVLATGKMASDYFEFPDREGDVTRCYLWYPGLVEYHPLPLAAVVFQQFKADIDRVKLVKIPRHQALMELPKHLHMQRGMAHDLPLLNQRLPQGCRFYQLAFPDVHQAWKELMHQL